MESQAPPAAADTVQLTAVVPTTVADLLRDKARAAERSTAAEIRLALRAWVDEPQKSAA